MSLEGKWLRDGGFSKATDRLHHLQDNLNNMRKIPGIKSDDSRALSIMEEISQLYDYICIEGEEASFNNFLQWRNQNLEHSSP